MVTGELRSQIDRIWDSFWAGGIANPLEVIEQLTFLWFIKRLDELQTLAENKPSRLGEPIERPLFPGGTDGADRATHLTPGAVLFSGVRFVRRTRRLLEEQASATREDVPFAVEVAAGGGPGVRLARWALLGSVSHRGVTLSA